MPDSEDVKEVLQSLSAETRAEIRQQLRALNQARLEELRAWWIERMVLTPRPFEEKLTLFWHGYFTTGAQEVGFARLVAEQNAMLRRHGPGSFRTLLSAACRDRALLLYLDSDSNKKAHPNENFARELLELFTMGAGNYTEEDILAAARAFTGWSVSPEGFQFRERQHDKGEKTFLGRTGSFDGGDIIAIILEQPVVSRYVAARLLRFFTADQPSEALVEAVAAKLEETDFNLRETLRALFKSEAFYRPDVLFEHVKSPVELTVGAARALGLREVDAYGLARAMRVMGQELFQPPNVKGWDGGRAWINSATWFARREFAGQLVNGTPERAYEQRVKKIEEIEQIQTRLRELMGSDEPFLRVEPQTPVRRQERYDPRMLLGAKRQWTNGELIVHLCDVLIHRKLRPEQYRSLTERLGDERVIFDLTDENAVDRLRKVIRQIMLLPDFQAS
jgi:uncharacterized protein (DUF1800 family)